MSRFFLHRMRQYGRLSWFLIAEVFCAGLPGRVSGGAVYGGGYRSWIDQFSRIPPRQRAFDKDYDRDGLCNFLEFAFGRNPLVDEGGQACWLSAAEMQLHFHVHPSIVSPYYQLKQSLSLSDPFWQTVSNAVFETDGPDETGLLLMTVNLPDQDSGFFRVDSLVPEEIRQVVDVRDFGVNMEDGADDTVALQAALNQGGIILIPPGVALLTNALQVVSGTWLVGCGSAASELRWNGGATTGGLCGGSMAVSGLGLRTMVPLDNPAILCWQGPFHISGLWIATAASGSWQDGICLENVTNSTVSSVRYNGDTAQGAAAVRYSGRCVTARVEDLHSRNSGYGILIDGDCSGLEMRRVSLIGCLYGIYIDPDNVASNVAVYDFDTSCSRGCLWINNTVDSVFCGGYAGLNGWDNILDEGAVTVSGASTRSLTLRGVRMQNNYSVIDTACGIVIRQCDGLDVCAVNMRGMKWGVVARAVAQNVLLDAVELYGDVLHLSFLDEGADVRMLAYVEMQ